VAFGFVLGRWVPWIGSRAKVGCAAPVGCLSWVFWFAIAYAVPVASADPSTDDSGALGAIVFGPFVLLLIIALLGLGVERGVAHRARTTDGAE
jgi:nitrate reductase gamma subunit